MAGLETMAGPGEEEAGPKRFDPSLALVFLGIALVFGAFLAAGFWAAGWAIYFLGGGIAMLAAGFYFASRSG